MSETILLEAVVAILSARDFCGNEKDALQEVEEENEIIFSKNDKLEIYARVSNEWQVCQQAAGVKHPLTSEERARAFRDIESGK